MTGKGLVEELEALYAKVRQQELSGAELGFWLREGGSLSFASTKRYGLPWFTKKSLATCCILWSFKVALGVWFSNKSRFAKHLKLPATDGVPQRVRFKAKREVQRTQPCSSGGWSGGFGGLP